jgi:NAD(P)-dependent dehydrogenase (short-subunit alcohol dehydrogenase family)
VVKHFLGLGVSVHVPWIVEDEVEALRSYLGDLAGGVHLRQVDVCNEEEVEGFFAAVDESEGRLDVLCNIVGGFVFASLADTELADWRRMQEMNATSAFLSCKAAVPLMRASGGGRIANVTAMPALNRGAAHMSAYAASKAAVLNFSQSLASELAADGITVNAIAPSIIDTPANREAMPDADTENWLLPEEIAAVVAFLAGDAARIVTGSVLALSKGESKGE